MSKTDNEKILDKLKAKVLEEFPEASPRDAMLVSGFAALFIKAPPDIKVLMEVTLMELIAEAKKLNDIARNKEKKSVGKKNILN